MAPPLDSIDYIPPRSSGPATRADERYATIRIVQKSSARLLAVR
jgi:hypothetical protein